MGSSSSPINLSCLESFIDSYPNGKAETSGTGKNFQNGKELPVWCSDADCEILLMLLISKLRNLYN